MRPCFVWVGEVIILKCLAKKDNNRRSICPLFILPWSHARNLKPGLKGSVIHP